MILGLGDGGPELFVGETMLVELRGHGGWVKQMEMPDGASDPWHPRPTIEVAEHYGTIRYDAKNVTADMTEPYRRRIFYVVGPDHDYKVNRMKWVYEEK